MSREKQLREIIETINRIAVINYGDQITLSLNQVSNTYLNNEEIDYIITTLHREYKISCVKVRNLLVIEKLEMDDRDYEASTTADDEKVFIIIIKNIYNRLRYLSVTDLDSGYMIFHWEDLYSHHISSKVKSLVAHLFIKNNIHAEFDDNKLLLKGIQRLNLNNLDEDPFPDIREESNYVFTNTKT